MNCDKWFYLCLSLVFVILAGLVMIFKYFLRLDRNGVKLGQADKRNENRIKHLEEKNGKELKEIEALKVEINTLKGVIESITRNERK